MYELSEMSDKFASLLNQRSEFVARLDDDIAKNESIREAIEKGIKSLQETRENIKELSKQPERSALIPLCSRLYVEGTIVHTGEYLVTKQAHPHSYLVLKTAEQTVEDLNNRISAQRELEQKADLAVTQLIDRKKLLLGELDEKQNVADEEYPVLASEVADMPDEIRSERGVAVKVGGFFEILEYEEDG